LSGWGEGSRELGAAHSVLELSIIAMVEALWLAVEIVSEDVELVGFIA
jgi:hypothetical protein